MSTFQGIQPEGLLLLARNRFEDSKEFYEAHKDQIKAQIFVPMAQLIADLSDDFLRLDPLMPIVPNRMISRIRRDTRFTKEKHLYRDNVWLSFERRGGEPVPWPGMWFGVEPERGEWHAGIGIFMTPPAYMEVLRKHILRDSEDLLSAAEQAVAAGARFCAESYKRDRAPGAPEALKPYLNAKNFYFMLTSRDMEQLSQPVFVETLRALYSACMPMYRFFLASSEEYVSNQG